MFPRKKRHVRARSFHPWARRDHLEWEVERLEDRCLLAGNVDVSVTGGSLMVTGDAAGNDVLIDQVSLAAGQFRFNTGPNSTTLLSFENVV